MLDSTSPTPTIPATPVPLSDDDNSYHAFEPNEVIFVVEHNVEQNTDQIINQLQSVLTALTDIIPSDYTEFLQEPTFATDRVVSFDSASYDSENAPPFLSLVFVRFDGLDDDNLINLIYQLYKARSGESSDAFQKDGLVVRAATPNWISISAPDTPPTPPDSGGGGGGPGSKPIQANLPPSILPNAPWRFHLEPISATVPSVMTDEIAQYIVSKYAKWVDEKYKSPTQATVVQRRVWIVARIAQYIINMVRKWLNKNYKSPTKVSAVKQAAWSAVHKAYSNLAQALESKKEPKDGKVRVVILDTAPPPHTIDLTAWEKALQANYGNDPRATAANFPPPRGLIDAYNQWQQGHPLINSLLTGGPVFTAPDRLDSNVLHIHYNPEFNDPGTGPISPIDPIRSCKRIVSGDQFEYTDWAMDHGLFIAGIVHSLAPQVQIHLIETLNAYGGGNVYFYAKALHKLLDIVQVEEFDPDDQIVVNMSWMYNIPTHPDHPDPIRNARLTTENGDVRLVDLLLEDPNFRDFLTRSIALPSQRIFGNLPESAPAQNARQQIGQSTATIHKAGGLLVAAAGNDGRNGGHPSARYPALLPDVIGVAALDRNQNYTSYTNQADDPSSQGVAVFGGEATVVPQSFVPDDPNPYDANTARNVFWATTGGILGIYTGDFPDNNLDVPTNPNRNKLDPFRTIPNTTGWAYWSGTSFATPIIAGLLAELLRQGHDRATALEIIRLAFIETPPGTPEFVRVRQGP